MKQRKGVSTVATEKKLEYASIGHCSFIRRGTVYIFLSLLQKMSQSLFRAEHTQTPKTMVAFCLILKFIQMESHELGLPEGQRLVTKVDSSGFSGRWKSLLLDCLHLSRLYINLYTQVVYFLNILYFNCKYMHIYILYRK